MKRFFLAITAFALTVLCGVCPSQTGCPAPSPGTPRVLAGGPVRDRLVGLLLNLSSDSAELQNPEPITVPPRVTVQRAQQMMSCAELQSHAEDALQRFPFVQQTGARQSAARPQADLTRLLATLDCGPAARLPKNARFELTRIFWDLHSRHWELVLRCLDPKQCLPFLLHTNGSADKGAGAFASLRPLDARRSREDAKAEPAQPLVRPGQTLTLIWDEHGIRAIVPVICLDRGVLGDAVRVRVKNGSHVLRGEVIGAAMVRQIS